MLNQPTLQKFETLRLHGMADAFRAQSEQAGMTELSFEERFALLVDQEWTWRENRALARRLTHAKLRNRASVATSRRTRRSASRKSCLRPRGAWLENACARDNSM